MFSTDMFEYSVLYSVEYSVKTEFGLTQEAIRHFLEGVGPERPETSRSQCAWRQASKCPAPAYDPGCLEVGRQQQAKVVAQSWGRTGLGLEPYLPR